MSGFKRNFKYNTTFDGDEVEFILTGLTRKDVIQLTPIFSKIQDNITEEEALNLANIFMDVLSPHITSLTGLKDGDGVAVEAKTMITEQYFFTLSQEVINHLMEKSNPVAKVEEEKKSLESSHTTLIGEQVS